MFKKILIANRGEIALRIHRACKEMGIQTVAVHSTADAHAMHVRMADESVCIGPPPATQSYLSVPNIISACEITGAEAIHPGYGFLSENAAFVQIVEDHGLTFIGPTSEHIRLMGDKITAKETMRDLGVPCVPGTDGGVPSLEVAERVAKDVGFPLIVKATAGGGGRGMKLARRPEDLATAFQTARSEAKAAFGNDEVYLERYLTRPRHIEIQVFGDGKGHAVHLGERDCSLQRRHQKVFEEAPSPVIDAATRARIGKVCADAVAADRLSRRRDHRVPLRGRRILLHRDEHPPAGRASGDRGDLRHRHRPGADPCGGRPAACPSPRKSSFLPDTPSNAASMPSGCRTSRPRPDGSRPITRPAASACASTARSTTATSIPPYYDSLIGKLIVHARTRDLALARLRRALSELIIDGVDDTMPLFDALLEEPDIQTGAYDIHWLEKWLARDA